MTAKWVDFKIIRERLQFEDVLSHYGIDVQGRGQQIKILCPFHDDHKPSCGVNMAKKIFNCFPCGAGGNVLDFVAMMEELDPDDTSDLRQAALLAADTFGISEATIKPKRGKTRPKSRKPSKAKNGRVARSKPSKGENAPPTKQDDSEAKNPASQDSKTGAPEVNLPLSFSLDLDAKHPFIKARKKELDLKGKTIKTFGVGHHDGKGIMNGRVCFPIHNAEGKLVAYSGRWPEEVVPDDKTKYRLPNGFAKSNVLFNLNRVLGMREAHPDLDTVVIVEGFWSVMRLHQMGVPSVATFGDSVSSEQIELLVQNGFTSCILIYDGDEGGRSGTEQSLPLLATNLFTKVVHLEDGVKPDTMDNKIVSALPRYC